MYFVIIRSFFFEKSELSEAVAERVQFRTEGSPRRARPQKRSSGVFVLPRVRRIEKKDLRGGRMYFKKKDLRFKNIPHVDGSPPFHHHFTNTITNTTIVIPLFPIPRREDLSGYDGQKKWGEIFSIPPPRHCIDYSEVFPCIP
jgi:hypothetical protein